MADVKREFTVVAVNTTLGNQDVTISGFGTPKAAQFFLSEAVTDDAIASGGAISVGFSDGTYSACVSVANEDGQTSTDTQRTPGFGGSSIASVSDPNGGTKCTLDFVSWITDGVRISVDSNAVPAGYLLTVVLWGGADLDSVKCVERGLQSSTAAQTYTGIGFEFDVLFLAHCYASVNGGLVHSPFAYGCVINDNAAAPTQKAIGFCGDNGSASGDQNTIASDTYALVAPLIGSNRWNLTISDITSTGYTHTTSSSSSTTTIQLALKFAAGVDFSLTDVSIPTSGNLVESGLSFQPEFTQMGLIQGPSAYDTLDTAAPSASLAFALTDSSQVHTISTSDEDGSADTVCKSLSSDQFRMLDYQGSADAFLASGYSLDSNGWTYTLTTNPAAAILGWAFAFSSGGGGGGTTYTQGLAGSLTPVGVVDYNITFDQGVGGTIAMQGVVSKLIDYTLAGGVTPAGDITKQVDTSMDGSVTLSGDVTTNLGAEQALAGSMTMTGSVVKSILKYFEGSTAPSGDITKLVNKGVSGSITPSGSIQKMVYAVLSGSLTPTGTIVTGAVLTVLLTGQIAMSGIVSTVFVPLGTVVTWTMKKFRGMYSQLRTNFKSISQEYRDD